MFLWHLCLFLDGVVVLFTWNNGMPIVSFIFGLLYIIGLIMAYGYCRFVRNRDKQMLNQVRKIEHQLQSDIANFRDERTKVSPLRFPNS